MKENEFDTSEYIVRLVDMPAAVGGMIAESPDGFVNIYINSRNSHQGQLDAFEHELDHWRNDDLHNDKSIQEVECASNHRQNLVRASDLPKKQKKVPTPFNELKDDILLKLPFSD